MSEEKQMPDNVDTIEDLVKHSLAQTKVKLAGQIYNGDPEDEDDPLEDEDFEEEDTEETEEDDDEIEDEDLEVPEEIEDDEEEEVEGAAV